MNDHDWISERVKYAIRHLEWEHGGRAIIVPAVHDHLQLDITSVSDDDARRLLLLAVVQIAEDRHEQE